MVFKRIRDLREDADLKQKDVAAVLNCSQQVYSNYELGQRDIPTDILIALAKYYETTTDYILELSDDRYIWQLPFLVDKSYKNGQKRPPMIELETIS